MCDNAYHMEALRKARVLERQRAAQVRAEGQSNGDLQTYQSDPRSGPAETGNACEESMAKLEKFRVNDAGFDNRYRGRAGHAPHVDEIYKVMYPNKDNKDYTCDPVRNNRRQLVHSSDYEIRSKINGAFDVRMIQEAGTAEAVKSYGY